MGETVHTKELKAEYQRKWRQANPDLARSNDLKKRFGITLEDYNQMMAEQKGVCKICGFPETKLDHRTKQPRRLAVDHCHKTGRVRALLCSDCNTAIGLLKEDVELMRKAIEYVSAA